MLLLKIDGVETDNNNYSDINHILKVIHNKYGDGSYLIIDPETPNNDGRYLIRYVNKKVILYKLVQV